jgi:hypothetical protein
MRWGKAFKNCSPPSAVGAAMRWAMDSHHGRNAAAISSHDVAGLLIQGDHDCCLYGAGNVCLRLHSYVDVSASHSGYVPTTY